MRGCSGTGADSFRDGLDDTDYLSSERHQGTTNPAGVKPELLAKCATPMVSNTPPLRASLAAAQ